MSRDHYFIALSIFATFVFWSIFYMLDITNYFGLFLMTNFFYFVFKARELYYEEDEEESKEV